MRDSILTSLKRKVEKTPGCEELQHTITLTHSESVYACNFANCTNRYGLQRPDTKAPGNTTERKGYNACNEITRVKLGGAHDLT